MLDIKLIRESPEIVRKDLQKRNWNEKLKDLEEIVRLDEDWRSNSFRLDQLRKERNQASEQIAAMKQRGIDVKESINHIGTISQEIKSLEEKNSNVRVSLDSLLMRMPNITHESVPVGADETGNKTIRTFGTVKKLTFVPKSHVDLLESLDLVDLARAANVSGARFYYLKNEAVLLDMALQHYAMEILVKNGFTAIEPPFMMKRKAYEGVTDLADFEQVLYKIEGEDLHLIATSEHPMGAMFMGETLEADKLPLKLAGISTCFRKEAGAHGKDTKGIFRVHQFNKIEMFVFSTQEQSWKLHEQMIKIAEQIWKGLKIPYRVVNICTGDLGTVAAKKYDIEAWMPAQNAFREVVSCSNCTDYQANRLKIKYEVDGKEGKEKRAVHTLNGTAIATSRAIVAILENYQTAKGTIKIPSVLQKYMNGMKEIKSKITKQTKAKKAKK